MILVRPATIDDTVLTASSVAESEPVHDLGHTYAEGNRVRGTGDLEHVVFESLQATNLNHALDEPASLWWIRVGATNRWAMFDGSIGRQTTAMDEIEVTLVIPGRADALALLNISAATVHVVMTAPVDGVVYDRTFSLASDSGIDNWYDWLFEPVERTDRLIVTDLPAYAGATLVVTLSDAGETVTCGELVVGFSKNIGDTQFNPNLGITDTTPKTRDTFGAAEIGKPRPFYDMASFTLNVPDGYVNELKVLLPTLRATAILWIGDPDYPATVVYGFFRSFNIVIPNKVFSLCSLDIEGLT